MENINIYKKRRWKYFAFAICLYLLFLSIPIVLTYLESDIMMSFTWDYHSSAATVINGITTPLLSFITIWLTFEAFWVQYESNINQLLISEKQRKSGEIQIQDLKEERFENRFFYFINLIQEQEKDAIIPLIGSSKQAYHFMFYEYKAICFQIAKYGVYENMPERRKLELDQAFHLFLNGVSKSSISRLSEESKGIELEKIKQMNEYLLSQQEYYITNKKMPKYLMDYNNNGIKLFDGHRLYLVPFYRSFCMTLQYLYKSADQKSIDNINLYRNILLAQFSEHEIALLRIIYLYGRNQNLMFIEECYKERMDTFFRETLLDYIISKTMNSESEGFIDI
ncbi:MAG: hypothetical protein IKB57_02130 [Bacteroidaceae bacterium]|nr:hypothetical protein [Bacteroidaceae bacterium]